ncbi:MAG TPA: hypothetical protein VMI31_19300 [Fimbriimonadaceae bacterium]|nr:hypothetical protein [Fimbriimonadaceae bacterium]
MFIALLSSLSIQPFTDAPVTFQATGPAKSVLAKLSKQSGIDLHASGTTAGETLIVSVKDVPLNAVMDHVAFTLTAHWERDGQGYKLDRSSAEESKIQAIDIDRLEARFKAALAKAEPSEKGVWDSAAAAKYVRTWSQKIFDAFEDNSKRTKPQEVYGDTSLNNPGGRAMWSLLSTINPRTLAESFGARRLVFSTSPNSMQLPFPGDISGTLQTFLHEDKLFESAVKAAEVEMGDESKSAALKLDSFAQTTMGPGNPRLGIGRAHLIIWPLSLGSCRVTLTMDDPDGKRLAKCDTNLMVPEIKEKVEPIADADSIPFSADSLTFAKILRASRPAAYAAMSYLPVSGGSKPRIVPIAPIQDGSGEPPIDTATKQILLHPEQRDPMGFAPTEGFLAAGDSRKENVVAWVPDRGFASISAAATDQMTVGDFLTRCTRDWGITISEHDGWLAASPRSPRAAEQSETDRDALGALLRRMNEAGYLGLSDLSSYALTKEVGFDGFDLCYLQWLNPTVASRWWRAGTWQMLKLYGLFSEAQRGELARSSQLALSGMTPQQSQILSDMVFNGFQEPRWGTPSKKAPSIGDEGYFFEPTADRTDLLPNGVVTSGYFSVYVQSGDAALARNSKTGGSDILSVDELATTIAEQDLTDPIQARLFGRPASFDGYQAGKVRSLSYTFLFAPNLSYQTSLQDCGITEGMSLSDFASLPDGLRSAVQSSAADQRRAAAEWAARIGGNGKTPPPVWLRTTP